jgi:DNA polymerase III epsilon subunit-like protein
MTTSYKRWTPWLVEKAPKFGYEQAIESLREIKDMDIALLDVECTSLKAKESYVTEIAILSYPDLDVLLESYVKPDQMDMTKFDSSKASEVSGIKAEHLIDAPSFAEVYPYVLELCRGKVIAGWNTEFDYRQLAANAFRNGLPVLKCSLLDVMSLFSAYVEMPYHFSLEEAMNLLQIEQPEAHIASNDCYSTGLILQHMIKEV